MANVSAPNAPSAYHARGTLSVVTHSPDAGLQSRMLEYEAIIVAADAVTSSLQSVLRLSPQPRSESQSEVTIVSLGGPMIIESGPAGWMFARDGSLPSLLRSLQPILDLAELAAETCARSENALSADKSVIQCLLVDNRSIGEFLSTRGAAASIQSTQLVARMGSKSEVVRYLLSAELLTDADASRGRSETTTHVIEWTYERTNAVDSSTIKDWQEWLRVDASVLPEIEMDELAAQRHIESLYQTDNVLSIISTFSEDDAVEAVLDRLRLSGWATRQVQDGYLAEARDERLALLINALADGGTRIDFVKLE